MACTLRNATYDAAGSTATFQIEITCPAGASGRAYPVAQPLVVGLSLYSAKDVSTGRESYPTSYGSWTTKATQKDNPGKKERGFVRDGNSDVFDFRLKDIVIARDTKTLVVKFEASAADVEPYAFMLFAVWPKKQVSNCDSQDKYARNGCARYGYVVGGETVGPTDFFPGLEITSFVHPSGEWTSERWIVERFR